MSEPNNSDAAAIEPPTAPLNTNSQRYPLIGAVSVGVVVGVALLIGSAVLICIFLLSITSRCGFVSQWNALTGSTPLVPIPASATLLSSRTADGEPFQNTAGTLRRLYGELYHTPAPPATIVAFYQQHHATCRREGAGSSAYWHCEVDATYSGWGWVDIFTPPAYLVAPAEDNVDTYNFSGPLPNEGTILRTFVNWCDDV